MLLSFVAVKVYDIVGREVVTLLNKEKLWVVMRLNLIQPIYQAVFTSSERVWEIWLRRRK